MSEGRADITIPLGYAVGSGTRVDIPLRHMVVTGQTQAAGKTTALEALVERGKLRAVTFVTKRGEGAFADGRRIPPYFTERADWQFVGSLIDATLNEKNRFIRSWLMKVCHGTSTLAQVYANVKREKAAARRGIDEGVYTQIQAYLDLVIPQLERLPASKTLKLSPGLNVIDLSPYSTELQGLVIRSVIDHVADYEANTVTVIPEAWEFLPEGRGSPVKLAAETLIRKGAALGNFMWVDAQDLGGLWKTVVRAAAVYLVGVQREANEVKRTLANLPASVPRLKPADIAVLSVGEFYACFGRHAFKVYVQPRWMAGGEAHDVAIGKIGPSAPPARRVKEVGVTAEDAARLERDNARLTAENADLRRRLEALEKARDNAPGTRSDGRGGAALRGAGAVDRGGARGEPGTRPEDRVDRAEARSGRAFAVEESFDNEALYQAFKARLAAEAPALLSLAVTQPEMEVVVTRKVVKADGETLPGRIALLLKDGYFDDIKGTTSVLNELRRRGYTGADNVRREVTRLAEMGFLTKEDGGYLAVPGMKVRVNEQ